MLWCLSSAAARHRPAREGRVIRVPVAEDMRILRDTLVAVLNLEDDIDVVAQVAVIPAPCSHRSPDYRSGRLDYGLAVSLRAEDLQPLAGRRDPAGPAMTTR
jgi:hypothetical protein